MIETTIRNYLIEEKGALSKPNHHKLHTNLQKLVGSLMKRGIVKFDRATKEYYISEGGL